MKFQRNVTAFAFVGGLLAWVSCSGLAAAETASRPTEAQLYEAAKKEGKIVWYEGGPLDAMSLVAAEFEKKYPGVHVEVQRFPGVALYQRFMQEEDAGQYIADVMQLTDQPSMKDLIDNDHIAEWPVPTHDRFAEQYHIKDFAYAPVEVSNVIAYNPKKVSPEEVTLLASGWKSILDPRFKGRYSVIDQNCGSCYGPISLFFDPKYVSEYGADFLNQVVADKPPVYRDVTMGVDRIVAGEQDITYWVSDTSPYGQWLSGAPVAWVYPNPTPEWPVHWLAIAKQAPHPNAARLFQDWQMSEDGANAYQMKAGLMTSIGGFPDSRPVTKQSWYKPPVKTYDVDYDRWAVEFDKNMATWHAIVTGSK
jgi:ABC-type Fe3+ transport system substrate-binding protein